MGWFSSARSAPARVARLLARAAGKGGLEVLGAILQGKTMCVLQRATRDSSGARNFCLFLGPLRGQGAHIGAMSQNAFVEPKGLRAGMLPGNFQWTSRERAPVSMVRAGVRETVCECLCVRECVRVCVWPGRRRGDRQGGGTGGGHADPEPTICRCRAPGLRWAQVYMGRGLAGPPDRESRTVQGHRR